MMRNFSVGNNNKHCIPLLLFPSFVLPFLLLLLFVLPSSPIDGTPMIPDNNTKSNNAKGETTSTTKCECGHVARGEVRELQMPFPDGQTRTLQYDSEPIGAGSFSTVYHSTLPGDDASSKCVALKISKLTNTHLMSDFDRATLEAQKNEWEILSTINKQIKSSKRRHIIELYANSTAADADHVYMYTVLEMGNGGNLMSKRLKQFEAWKKEGLKPAQVLTDKYLLGEIMDVVKTMEEMHQLVIHLDFKPTNLIYDAMGRMKAIDFGGSTLISAKKLRATDSCTWISKFLYTQNYAPPEMTCGTFVPNEEEGEGNNSGGGGLYLSTKADIWTIGVILYQPFFFDRIPRIEKGVDPDDVIEPITDPLQYLYTAPEGTMDHDDWAALFGVPHRDWVLDMLRLVLSIHRCCPRTFHLILATQQLNSVDRPTARGIHEYLDGKCRLPTEGAGAANIEIWPALSLETARGLLLNVANANEKELLAMVDAAVEEEKEQQRWFDESIGKNDLSICETVGN